MSGDINNHNFDSQIIDTHSFESKINNTHSFTSIIINSRIYEIVLSGFTQTNSWFARFADKNQITVNAIKSIGNLSANFISISVMTVKTVMNFTGVLSANFVENNNIKAIIKSSQNMGTATIILTNNIVARMSSLFRIATTNKITTQNTITATLVGKKYYTLSDWYGYNLSDLYTKTLDEMSFHIV
jgi:hypothetical protein